MNIVLLAMLMVGIVIGCQSKDEEKGQTKPKTQEKFQGKTKDQDQTPPKQKDRKSKLPEGDEVARESTKARAPEIEKVDYLPIYCERFAEAELRADFSEEINFLCDGNKPREDFKNLVKLAIDGTSEPKVVRFIENHDAQTEISDLMMVFLLHIPESPFNIKAQKLWGRQYMKVTRYIDERNDPIKSGA